MQKTLLFSSILFGLLNIPSIIFSYPYEYKDFYVLGDSLNDSTDKSKLVSGGDTNPTQSESLSQKIFKRPLIDYKNGGTNFSLFGNEIHELVQEMDEEGFNIHQIGNNNLIFLSIGNNDIITEFWYYPFKWLVQDQLHYNDKITNQLSTLAKVVGNNQDNTVMVNTIPDMTLTPLFSSILVFPRIDIPQYIDF
ncbi:hypothetical protein GKC56_08175 [Neisseriaceae bacterium PsAf]|nr:hypothetical protein [Neisseriaceae bacterium PsAf]